jgi:hypothetical protein
MAARVSLISNTFCWSVGEEDNQADSFGLPKLAVIVSGTNEEGRAGDPRPSYSTKDEARRIAANVSKLLELLHKRGKRPRP